MNQPFSCFADVLTQRGFSADNPSLAYQLAERVERSYQVALKQAVKKMALFRDCFPMACLYTLEQILNDDFYPEAV